MGLTSPSDLMQRSCAEALGTMIIVFAGCGAISMSQGGFISSALVPVAFGLAVATMIYSLGHISAAHFNPSVSLGFWWIGRMSTKDLVAYITAQFVGGICGMALLQLIMVGPAFGATIPLILPWKALICETVLSFMLMIMVMAVATDKRVVPGIAGFAVGSIVCLDATFGGPMTGASMNPARSFGPALMSGQWDHLWIYLLGPSLGCVLAAKLYVWMALGDASALSPLSKDPQEI